MSRKCVICKTKGSEGYFKFPVDSKTQNSWLEKCPDASKIVIDGKISDSKRVCYRHFQTDVIQFDGRGYKIPPGKLCL